MLLLIDENGLTIGDTLQSFQYIHVTINRGGLLPDKYEIIKFQYIHVTINR